MRQNKKTLKENFSHAVTSFKKKDYKNAEFICYKVLSIDSNHIDSISLLATIFALKKNFLKAKEFMEKALEIQPNHPGHLCNLATTHKELGNLKEAVSVYEKALKINPDHVNSNYNLGLIFFSLRKLEIAKNYLKKTVKLQNNYANAYLSLGNTHADLKETNDAMSCYKRAIEINPKLGSAHNNIGLLYRDLNDFENAIKSYKESLKLNPQHANSYHNLGVAYKETAQFEKSIECHQMAIKYEPENLLHYHFLFELKEDILDIPIKSKIENILKKKNHLKINQVYGNFLLAKYERNAKSYENELSHLIKAHDNFYILNQKKFDSSVKYFFDGVLKLRQLSRLENNANKSDIELKPIFIVGVPRCGSTLVERIITSGNKFIPLGEETGVLGHFLPSKLSEKKSLNFGPASDLRKDLFSIYSKKNLVHKKYDYTFTDKSLDNFFYLELIKDIYPKAKIVNCKRDTLASIMSIFQNNLTVLAWTHNLDNIFKYFDNYFKIIEKFSKEYPKMIYHLDYDKLVKNPKEESKKLMDFCDVPWDTKCLEFYKRKDLFSKTASNIQIRQAIYKSSSDKYLPYKNLLYKYGRNYSWFNK
ncbi:MAG: Tetratricopeptide (TPR) repeat/Tfp pilus assembly protein PilF [Pelagibacterales bacterium]|nr:Tetratricopeptide (TPR) repeat/Tfp pilus assembly protein PilF [Pelagibacterales bacterium]